MFARAGTRPGADAPDSAASSDAASVAREIGFGQCVQALRRTIATTPAGWLLVSWIAWDRAPRVRIAAWVACVFCAWVIERRLTHRILHEGPAIARHSTELFVAAALDGIGWGALAWFLMGFDPTLDPWLSALLCGAAAINAPVYITCLRAYGAMMGSMWATVVLAIAFHPQRAGVREELVGLTLFVGLIGYYMQSIAQRVHEGIRLQLSNASLAERLDQALQLVRQEASTDALTGSPNRRALDVLLRQQFALAQFPGRPFSVLMLDIDHFKLVNDVHGHAVGDATLRAFAQRVREHLRQGDACTRYGGEEFVVVLPGTTLAAAVEVAERLRHGVAERALLAEPTVRVTVSLGAAQYLAGETIEQVLERADAAVYAAKRCGRNQVCVPEAAALAPVRGGILPRGSRAQ